MVKTDTPAAYRQEVMDSRWTLWWVGKSGDVQQVRTKAAGLPTLLIHASLVHLLSPDDACSLVLSTNTSSNPVAVIGDSVFARTENALKGRGLPTATSAQRWQVSAISGFGWSASAPSWPLTTVRGSWVIGLARGYFSEHPSALVVELGANDALRAGFADALHHPDLAAGIRDAVALNIAEVVDQSITLVPCTVLVTASTAPTSLFGAGSQYVTEGNIINNIIRGQVAHVDSPRVVVADWASLSAAHHLAAGNQSNWFTSDEVHPNATGEVALVALVQQAISSCRTATN